MWRAWRIVEPAAAPALLAVNASAGARLHRGSGASAPVTAYCVYRSKNATYVREIVQNLPTGSTAHLHALDHQATSLTPWTRSHGPGPRIPLLQSLIDRHQPSEGRHLMIFDDDVTFLGDGARQFPGYCDRAGLDIAQPAHQPKSVHSFRVTRVAPLSTVRLTRFVESGPVVLLSPGAQGEVLPFPNDARMGWGLDVYWSGLIEKGLRLGVVDATPVIHHGAVAADYDNADEYAYQEKYLARAGISSPHELAGNVGFTWRPWQRSAKWRDGAAS